VPRVIRKNCAGLPRSCGGVLLEQHRCADELKID
jgi:hypothetical protein